MKLMKRWYVRTAAFFLGFLLLNQCVELAFLNVNPHNLITMTDLRQTESADVYFVGSSLLRDQVMAAPVTEESGLSAFTMSTENVMIPAQKAMLKQLFKTKSPRYVVVDFDLRTFDESPIEPALVQAYLWPFLSGDVKAVSVLETAPSDDGWLDRIFPWRYYHPDTVRGLAGNVAKKLFPQHFRDIYAAEMSPENPNAGILYTGRGHFGAPTGRTENIAYEYASYHRDYESAPLSEKNGQGLLELKAICEANDCQLILVIPPVHRAVALADETMLRAGEALAAFCGENDIPFWNFILIRNEVMEPLDHTFYNEAHIDAEGAEAFSHALGKLLKLHAAGEDTAPLFCTEAEYLDGIDSILNTYYESVAEGDKVTFTAHVNAGSRVVPVYQFAIADADGKETLVQPYSTENQVTVAADRLANGRMVVYAMNQATPEQPVCRYMK